MYKCVCLLVQRGANYTPLIHVHVHVYTCTLHLICTVYVLVHAHSVHVLLYRVLPRSRVDIEWCSSKEGRDFEGFFCRIFIPHQRKGLSSTLNRLGGKHCYTHFVHVCTYIHVVNETLCKLASIYMYMYMYILKPPK